MPRYIAFLRAINVGGRTAKMEVLRSCFEELGFAQVATFIASGNVIFEVNTENETPRQLEAKIEAALHKTLGYEVATFLRSDAELGHVANYQPFGGEWEEGHSLYISFLPSEPSQEAKQKLLKYRDDLNDFHLHGRELYWLCRGKISDSAVSGAMLDRTLKMPATMRNITTVKKLAAKYPPVANE